MNLQSILSYAVVVFLGISGIYVSLIHGLSSTGACSSRLYHNNTVVHTGTEGLPWTECIVKKNGDEKYEDILMKLTVEETPYKLENNLDEYTVLSYDILNGDQMRKELDSSEEQCYPVTDIDKEENKEMYKLYCQFGISDWFDFLNSVLTRGPIEFSDNNSIITPEIRLIMTNIPEECVFRTLGLVAKKHADDAVFYRRMGKIADMYCFTDIAGDTDEHALNRCLTIMGGMLYDMHKNSLIDEIKYIKKRTDSILLELEDIAEKRFLYEALAIQLALDHSLIRERLNRFRELHEEFLLVTSPSEYSDGNQTVRMSVGDTYKVLNKTKEEEGIVVEKALDMKALENATGITENSASNPLAISDIITHPSTVKARRIVEEINQHKNDYMKYIKKILDKIDNIGKSLEIILTKERTKIYTKKKYSAYIHSKINKQFIKIKKEIEDKMKESHKNFLETNNIISLLCKKNRIDCPKEPNNQTAT